MRIKIDIPLFDSRKKKPLTKQGFGVADVFGLLQKHAEAAPDAKVSDLVEKVLTEMRDCQEPETLGGAIYRAMTESETAMKGSASEKRKRASIANAMCSDEHPDYAEIKQDQLELIRDEVGAHFVTVWLSAIDKALEEALKLSPEMVGASAVAIVPDAKDAKEGVA